MVEWISALASYPEEIPVEHQDDFIVLMKIRLMLINTGFVRMITKGMFPSKGWWLEERIEIRDGDLVYSQRPMAPLGSKNSQRVA